MDKGLYIMLIIGLRRKNLEKILFSNYIVGAGCHGLGVHHHQPEHNQELFCQWDNF
jgi:hypothetical protein